MGCLLRVGTSVMGEQPCGGISLSDVGKMSGNGILDGCAIYVSRVKSGKSTPRRRNRPQSTDWLQRDGIGPLYEYNGANRCQYAKQ